MFLAVIAITAEARVTTEICNDGVDNDGDGLIDQADSDCVLPPTPEICGDGIDNDGDGFIDQADPDCVLPPTPEVCDDGIDNDGDGLIDHADSDCATVNTKRMTGGGSISKGDDAVRHGFTLSCNTTTPGLPHNLQVNWGKNKSFIFETFGQASCTDDPSVTEGKPVAGFDTHVGSGTGVPNGVAGVTHRGTITDAGEPGKDDTFSIKITDVNGKVVLEKAGQVQGGNHQAHP